ncbi:MAG: prolyl oligopeptidase family serine peptidase [Clostridia bacterium]|nr:prolyl oligopeptidase family serine peptidase [Clostridia bacterium]
MKKIIVAFLVISIFCLSGCHKFSSVVSGNSSNFEDVDVNSSYTNNVDINSIITSVTNSNSDASNGTENTTNNINNDNLNNSNINSDIIDNQNKDNSNLSNSSNKPSTESSQINSSIDYNDSQVEENSSINSTTSNDDNTSSNTTNKVERPEKVTKVYNLNMNTAGTQHLKRTFYDSQNGNTLQYCLFLPDDYSLEKKYPVILFLHGAGEIGTDNTTQLNNIKNIFTNNADYVAQSILICPQTPEWWRLDRDYGDRKGTLSSAMHLLEKIQNEYSCDENRIYLTGLSMGGYATWELLQNYSHVFAAGVPVCGFGNEMNAATLVDIPIRIYHGTADPTVSFSNSQSMYDAIIAAGGTKVELFPLEGVGHDAWNTAYADSTMFEWMFAQDKSKATPAKIEPSSPFKIVDANGNAIITAKDVTFVDYFIVGDTKSGVDISLTLTDNGRSKLKKAYKNSTGKEFTVYFRLQKVYSFTATKPPIDNQFLMSGVFKIDNYLLYYHLLKDACSKN